jgi:hypothetical protein
MAKMRDLDGGRASVRLVLTRINGKINLQLIDAVESKEVRLNITAIRRLLNEHKGKLARWAEKVI